MKNCKFIVAFGNRFQSFQAKSAALTFAKRNDGIVVEECFVASCRAGSCSDTLRGVRGVQSKKSKKRKRK